MSRNLKEIEHNRTGGQIALRGYEYQCLYSAYILLSFLDSDDKKIRLEGMEDVDTYSLSGNNKIQNIQVKYSKDTQDASFLKPILKNYLEVFLCDSFNHEFILVYDFKIAPGYFSKLIVNNPDKKTLAHWEIIVNEIRKENPIWNWTNFDFKEFINCLSFKFTPKKKLFDDIITNLISKYEVTSGNESLFIFGLHYFCYEKMKNRGFVSYQDINKRIQDIKDEISKGTLNPAHNWIQKIDFEKLQNQKPNLDYYEGKKATPSDIVNNLPVRRVKLEKEIELSVEKNFITIIKSSSGQGKTTLAWQTAFNLRENFTVYQLTWCNQASELNHIVEYFRSRIKIGEKPLIILDNINIQLKEWNLLAQYLCDQIGVNYKLLLTTREDDWYEYSGDQSSLRSINIININLNITEAESIFNSLKSVGKLSQQINNWQSSWEKVSDKKLLIEYIYLLTQGEMISERVTVQIKNLQNHPGATIKCTLLRQICLADVLGIKLPSNALITTVNSSEECDIELIIKSLENEFYIRFADEEIYIQGLHPVRSQHIVEILHEYVDINDTIVRILDVVDDVFVSKLYSHLPTYISKDKEQFYKSLVDKTTDKNFAYLLHSLQGVFSGSVLNYYERNKRYFDDADEHSGLYPFLSEINPFNRFEEINTEVKTISQVLEIFPDNFNIQHLFQISKDIGEINLSDLDVYLYSKYLYEELRNRNISCDYTEYVELLCWLINIDKKFSLINEIDFDLVWRSRKEWGIQNIAELMYQWFIQDEIEYKKFVEDNKSEILQELKIATNSMKIYEVIEKQEIHIEYILLPGDISEANSRSVEKINLVCKMLPIYEYYCTDSISPALDIIDYLKLPENAVKRMPKRNVVIGFHSSYAKLWSDTILSKYEFATTYDWITYWEHYRMKIVDLFKLNCRIVEKRISNSSLGLTLISDFNELRSYIISENGKTRKFPHEQRPFEEVTKLHDEIKKFDNAYFIDVRNYFDQMLDLLDRDKKNSNLALYNLRNSKSHLPQMQESFRKIAIETGNFKEEFNKLDSEENIWLNNLLKINEFYIDDEAPSYYGKASVEKWIIAKQNKQLSNLKDKIETNNEFNFSFVFPNKFIEKENLVTYPIIVENYDSKNSEDIQKLLLTMTSLHDEVIQYILVISFNQYGKINSDGQMINLQFINKLVESITGDDPSLLEGQIGPFPQPIDIDISEYFSAVFEFEEEVVSPLEGIDEIILLLWEYSQYYFYLGKGNVDNAFYLSTLQNGKKMEIESCLGKRIEKIPNEWIIRINELKRKIFKENYYFSDSAANDLINELIQMILESRKLGA